MPPPKYALRPTVYFRPNLLLLLNLNLEESFDIAMFKTFFKFVYKGRTNKPKRICLILLQTIVKYF